ncbi:MAG: YbbR-like domain-containing protein [Bacillota bacterium]|jgi:YbbR domain-containing protein
MKKPNINNLAYKIISVLLAILLWLYVSHQENPVTEQIFTVPLEVRGLAEDLVVSNQPSFVKVRIQGQRKSLESITPRGIQAFVELSGLDVGNHIVEVHVTLPGKTQLVSIIPPNVNLRIELMTTIQLPVEVSYSDSTPSKGFLALEPVLTPTHVTVTGPEDKLKNIKQVYVDVNLGDNKLNFRQKLPVKIEDKGGNLVHDWLNVSPSEIDVIVPIVEEMPSKTVPVKISLKGTPALGYKIERLVTEPDVITIYGEFSKLKKINNLLTTPVDISNITHDVTKHVNIVAPEGISIHGEKSIAVIIKIERTVRKTYSNLPLKIKNLPQKMKDYSNNNTIQVIVEGPGSIMEKLEDNAIQPYVDLAGFGSGEQMVPVRVDHPETVSLVQVEPAEISITLP